MKSRAASCDVKTKIDINVDNRISYLENKLEDIQAYRIPPLMVQRECLISVGNTGIWELNKSTSDQKWNIFGILSSKRISEDEEYRL
ncbi:Hypothetical predicted protein [Octopus vulgaris]|uniref:Uncharacterized protein n=1 Tax=Octopus vulgaris TaxID=6645 RepID=A0AA36APG9_OCTVU|nr:Hypothetical predicted protein [Octopus vulgaris]